MTQELVRISKLMSQRGMCSRREADAYIEQGLVKVNGTVVNELGFKALPDAKIDLLQKANQAQSFKATIILNKPVGYLSHKADKDYKVAAALITVANQYKKPGDVNFNPSHLRGLAPAGRLDIDSQGMLVLTQDGRVAKRLIGEHSDIEKEYLVRVSGKLIKNGLALLNHGLSLDNRPLRPAKVSWLNEDQLIFRLQEGRKRQIRRMCDQVGLKVIGLKRVRMGRVVLGDLPPGKWRYLLKNEKF